jgi:hypothetical protein
LIRPRLAGFELTGDNAALFGFLSFEQIEGKDDGVWPGFRRRIRCGPGFDLRENTHLIPNVICSPRPSGCEPRERTVRMRLSFHVYFSLRGYETLSGCILQKPVPFADA